MEHQYTLAFRYENALEQSLSEGRFVLRLLGAESFDDTWQGGPIVDRLHRHGPPTSRDRGRVFCAPGARGFYGEGYPFHRTSRRFGMTWDRTGFAAKTTTVEKRAGNLPLKDDGVTPRELIPRCIVVKWLSGHVLNAVGLSGPGV